MKQKVYIETLIVSYLTARPSNDLRVMANQNTIIEWWESRMAEFEIYIPEFVVVEASQGNAKAAERRMSVIADIPELEVTETVRELNTYPAFMAF
jgi:hypothetical protein